MENKKSVVLVVEDLKIAANLIRRHLEKANYSVVVVRNGREAIKFLEKSDSRDLPCCITMAIMMPVMDGFDACEYIKKDKRFKDIPIIMASSLNQQVESIKHGADGFIGKPVEKIILLHEVGMSAKTTQLIKNNARLNNELAVYKSVQHIVGSYGGKQIDLGVDDSEY